MSVPEAGASLERFCRRIIVRGRPEVRLVYLGGGPDLATRHLAAPEGDFTPASLMQGDIDALEEPLPKEDALVIDLGASAADAPRQIVRLLAASVAIGSGAKRAQAEEEGICACRLRPT